MKREHPPLAGKPRVQHGEATVLDKVVVGIDFSDASFEAVRWATSHFARAKEIVLAHAVNLPHPPPILRGRFPRRDLALATLRAGAEKRLRELSLSLLGNRIWLEIREGDPAECLAKIGEDHSVDLIVVGAHGEGIGYPLGSTAESLVRLARSAVLLARGGADSPRTVLVAADEPAKSAEAFRWAALIAREYGARVSVIHVVPSVVASSVLAAAGQAGMAGSTTSDADGSWSPDALGQWAVGSGVAADHVSGEVAFGDPLREVLACSARIRADLIILSRRSRGNVRRAVLGSVVDGVLRGAGCPVLVVPQPDAAP